MVLRGRQTIDTKTRKKDTNTNTTLTETRSRSGAPKALYTKRSLHKILYYSSSSVSGVPLNVLVFVCAGRLVHQIDWCTIRVVHRFVFVLCLSRRRKRQTDTDKHADGHKDGHTDTQTCTFTWRCVYMCVCAHVRRHTLHNILHEKTVYLKTGTNGKQWQHKDVHGSVSSCSLSLCECIQNLFRREHTQNQTCYNIGARRGSTNGAHTENAESRDT